MVTNGLWYEIETDSTTARTKRLSNQRFCFIPLVSCLGGQVCTPLNKSTNAVIYFLGREKMFKEIQKDNPVICWFSGGITSAVACKIAIDLFGEDVCRCIFMDTKNEDDDTYRFLKDCENWYGLPIELITRTDYENIQEVWKQYKGLNFANGAICSSVLKRDLRKQWQKENQYSYQIFGYDIDEPKRAKAFTINYPEAKGLYPLLMLGYSKKMCVDMVENAGIEIPLAYRLGLNNNNCLKTGCVQGGGRILAENTT